MMAVAFAFVVRPLERVHEKGKGLETEREGREALCGSVLKYWLDSNGSE